MVMFKQASQRQWKQLYRVSNQKLDGRNAECNLYMQKLDGRNAECNLCMQDVLKV